MEIAVRVGIHCYPLASEGWKVESLTQAITNDLLNQSKSVHLRKIIRVNEEGEEKEEVEGGRRRRRKTAGSGDAIIYQVPNVCQALRGIFRVISYSDFKDKSIS